MNSISRAERRNFTRWACSLRGAAAVVPFLGGRICDRFAGRTHYPASHYPSEVRQVWRALARPDHPQAPSLRDVELAPGPPVLSLAHGSIPTNTPQLWASFFEDSELLVSLARWGWLIRSDDHEQQLNLAWGISLMQSFLAHSGALPAGIRSEPYTVSERIANAVLFAQRYGGGRPFVAVMPSGIVSALRQMVYYVADHIEYRSLPASGNHPINNARALVFAAAALGERQLLPLAAEVLRERLGYLISSDGFLREGSSHYHFLVTRWLLEIHQAAHSAGDKVIIDLVDRYLGSMLERCWFFLVPGRSGAKLPLIGDVSPDVPPRWLISLPWSKHAAEFVRPKWSSMLPAGSGAPYWGGLCTSSPPPAIQESRPRLTSFPDSWYRIDFGPLTIIWYVEPGDAVERASHSHQDLGSFALYLHGEPIIVDPGRLNYNRADPRGSYGVSAAAHSTLLVDGLSPVLRSWQTRFPGGYRASQVEVDSQIGEEVIFSLAHSGFLRVIEDPVAHTRVFQIGRDRLIVRDTLEGGASHQIERRFHLDGSLQCEQQPGKITARSPCGVTVTLSTGEKAGDSVTLVRTWSESEPGALMVASYGEAVSGTTVALRCDSQLPTEFVAEFRWGGI